MEIANDKTLETPQNERGLSVAAAVFFIVGDVVGAGIITLPYTMKLVGWLGVPLFFVSALLMCLCGILLSKGCLLAFSSVHNREALRDPYPQLAEKSYGMLAKYCVAVILNLSLIFTCIVFLLLLGEVFSKIAPIPTDIVNNRNQLRLWFVVCGIVLLPLTFLGTPKDFPMIGFLATACSFAAAVLIMLNIAMTSHTVGYTIPKKTTASLETILAVFGTIQFTFGGIAIFPTIQNDLKQPEKFPYAVVVGYTIVFFIYTSVSLSAFIILDEKIQEDILTTFTEMPLFTKCVYFRTYVTVAQILICGHVLCAFIMLVNPVNQQMEAVFNAPLRKFSLIQILNLLNPCT